MQLKFSRRIKKIQTCLRYRGVTVIVQNHAEFIDYPVLQHAKMLVFLIVYSFIMLSRSARLQILRTLTFTVKLVVA